SVPRSKSCAMRGAFPIFWPTRTTTCSMASVTRWPKTGCSNSITLGGARTVGLSAIAAAEWEAANEETRRLLAAFTAGVNAVIDESADLPPIEFALLDYRPEPWSPVDCLAIE